MIGFGNSLPDELLNTIDNTTNTAPSYSASSSHSVPVSNSSAYYNSAPASNSSGYYSESVNSDIPHCNYYQYSIHTSLSNGEETGVAEDAYMHPTNLIRNNSANMESSMSDQDSWNSHVVFKDNDEFLETLTKYS